MRIGDNGAAVTSGAADGCSVIVPIGGGDQAGAGAKGTCPARAFICHERPVTGGARGLPLILPLLFRVQEGLLGQHLVNQLSDTFVHLRVQYAGQDGAIALYFPVDLNARVTHGT